MMRNFAIGAMMVWIVGARMAAACPSCYSASATGPTVDGTNTAILFMLGVTGVMLTSIAFFFVMMRRRSRRLVDLQPVLHI